MNAGKTKYMIGEQEKTERNYYVEMCLNGSEIYDE